MKEGLSPLRLRTHAATSPAYANIAKITDTKRFVFFLCGILGAIAFIQIYGVAVLNFRYTDWLLQPGVTGGDTMQHYLGWRFFRNSGWHFPIGLMDNIVYPFKESIIYTDSIPLFAIIFKLLSPALPAEFQYFGLFGILCFMLQGGVSGLILKRLCDKTLYAVIGSMFFILSGPMIFRMFGHTSLAAHFIPLLCVYACVTKDGAQRGMKKNIAIWGGLLCLASTIHLYFVPMVFIFMAFDALDDCIVCRKPIRTILRVVLSTALPLLLLFALGAFYSQTDRSFGGLRSFGAGLVTLFDPMGMSTILQAHPVATVGFYEGSGYLGVGIILGLFLSVTILFANVSGIRKSFRSKDFGRKVLLPVALFCVFYVLALSPRVTYRGRILFTYPIPSIIEKVWGYFRATGRFIWIPLYIITLTVIWAIHKGYQKRAAAAILALPLVFQFQDLKDHFARVQEKFFQSEPWQTELPSGAWDRLADGRRHIVYLGQIFKLFSVASFANDHQMTLNDFYLARKDSASIEAYKEKEAQRFFRGDLDEGTLYILDPNQDYSSLSGEGFVLYQIDDVVVGLKDALAFEDESIKRLY